MKILYYLIVILKYISFILLGMMITLYIQKEINLIRVLTPAFNCITIFFVSLQFKYLVKMQEDFK